MNRLQIVDLFLMKEEAIKQVAILLFESFREHHPEAWSTLDSAMKEVQASLGKKRISRVAIDEKSQILGWIAAFEQYQGNVWELHPLVVRCDRRKQGIGSLLVKDLENCVQERGGLTLWVGTDDETNQTTLAGVNLYSHPWKHIVNLKNLNSHPYEFYQKCGFTIVGVMPDANGVGKPDIYMAKSLY